VLIYSVPYLLYFSEQNFGITVCVVLGGFTDQKSLNFIDTFHCYKQKYKGGNAKFGPHCMTYNFNCLIRNEFLLRVTVCDICQRSDYIMETVQNGDITTTDMI